MLSNEEDREEENRKEENRKEENRKEKEGSKEGEEALTTGPRARL